MSLIDKLTRIKSGFVHWEQSGGNAGLGHTGCSGCMCGCSTCGSCN